MTTTAIDRPNPATTDDLEVEAIRRALERDGWLVAPPIELRGVRWYVSAGQPDGEVLVGSGETCLAAHRELRWRTRRGAGRSAA